MKVRSTILRRIRAGVYKSYLDSGVRPVRVHFALRERRDPPADAFWSITLCVDEGFPVPNDLNGHALSSWMPFKSNAEGPLDLHFQAVSPGKDREANWLPSPKGPFTLTMRIYAPRIETLTRKWNPPPVVRKTS